MPTEPQSMTDESAEISIGWRAFQVLALIVGLSYIVGWVIGDPTRFLTKANSGGIVMMYAGAVLFLSPLVSILLLILAVDPNSLAFLTEKDTPAAKVALAVIFIFTLAWMMNLYLYTPMYTKLVSNPMGPAKVLPIPGGITLHTVFQHWFQSIAVFVFAIMPEKFATLTTSSKPAGVQCAVVDCK